MAEQQMPAPVIPVMGGSRTLAQMEAISERVAAGEPLHQVLAPPAEAPAPAPEAKAADGPQKGRRAATKEG